MSEERIELSGLVRVGVKLAGLALIIAAVIHSHLLFTALYTMSEGYGTWQVGYSVAYVLSFLLAGLVLWLFPKAVTDTVVTRPAGAGSGDSGWARRLETVGISLLGLYLLYCGLSDLVFHFLQSRAEAEALASFGQTGGSDYMPAYITTGVEIVFALVLLITPRGIVNLLHKLRSAGT